MWELDTGTPNTKCGELNTGTPNTKCGEVNTGTPNTKCGKLNTGTPNTKCGELDTGTPNTHTAQGGTVVCSTPLYVTLLTLTHTAYSHKQQLYEGLSNPKGVCDSRPPLF